MRELELHEQYEMRVLDTMRRAKALDKLIFGGGTMLRLCFRLPRYSVDLDFYVMKGKNFKSSYGELKEMLRGDGEELTDMQEKHFTYLLELRNPKYPRRLKIEIRKEGADRFGTMTNIAFSPFMPDLQVRVRTCTLEQMWKNKLAALMDRKQIRDAFDLEFLLKRGAGKISELKKEEVESISEIVNVFGDKDYRNTLGNLLNAEDRDYYAKNRFAYLRSELSAGLK